MKKYFFISLLLALAVALSAPLAFSQTANVRGVCKDIDGKPIAGAEVEWQSVQHGAQIDAQDEQKWRVFLARPRAG